MADISINKFRTAITRGGATPATPGFAETEGQDPVNPSGSGTQYGVGVGLSLDPTNRIQLGLEAYGGNRTIQITDWEDSGLAEIVTQTLDGTIYQNLSQFSAGNRQFYTNLTNTVGSGYATLSLISRNNSSFLELSRGSNTGFQGLKFLQDTDGYLMQITDTINSKGLEYFSDYESNFTARSLVTKQYVDGAVSGATISIGSPANGLSLAGTVLSLGLASSGVTGALSGTDWNTFNGKIGGTIASGQVAFGTGVNTVGGDSGLTWDNVNKRLGLKSASPLSDFQIGASTTDTNLLYRPLIIIGGFPSTNVRSQTLITFGATTTINTDPFSDISGEAFKNFHIGIVSDTSFRNLERFSIVSGGVERLSIIGGASNRAELGRVGIATTSPTNTLDVNGTTRIRTIPNLGSTATRFLVASATGVVSERTGAEMRADLSVIGGSIASGQVAFGTGVNTVGGDSQFIWDNTNKQLQTIWSGPTVSPNRGVLIAQFSNDVGGAILVGRKGRGTLASPSNVAAGDIIGAFSFSAWVGGTFTSDRSLFGSCMTSTTGQSLFFITGNTNNFYVPTLLIHENGNVGIGTGGNVIFNTIVTPVGRLNVRGSGTSTGITQLWEDSAGTDNAQFLDNGRIQLLRLPTSSAGLGANDLWNDGGNVVIGTTQTFRDESTAKTTASADQTLPSGVLTILDYDTTVVNNNTSIYTVGTTGRITVNSTGIYTITAGVVVEADAITALESAFLGIFRNGDLVAISSINTTIAAGAQSGLSTSTILSLTSGDIIDCRALVNSVGGVANGLARRLGTLLGANATQVNSLSITKSSQ